jgi:hypothetical protein
MRLAELEPRWWSQDGRHGQGVTFRCPCPRCQAGPRTVRLAVAFANPLDLGDPVDMGHKKAWWPAMGGGPHCEDLVPPGIHWNRTGDTFDTLSISPSVDASAAGHWHGFITKGEVR